MGIVPPFRPSRPQSPPLPRRVWSVILGALLAFTLACSATTGALRAADPVAQEAAPPAQEAPAPDVVEAPPEPPAAEVRGLQLLADNAATAAAATDLTQATLAGATGALAGRTLRLPAGADVEVLASGLRGPRFLALDGAGNLLVADAAAGAVYRYQADGSDYLSAGAPRPAPLLAGLDGPSNVTLHEGYLYVGETGAIARYAYTPDGTPGAREVVVPRRPRGGHSTRTVAFGPDGLMYVAVGSSCNICDEQDERRAAILRYQPDGTGYERFASGLRNPVGLAFQPYTGRLWATVNERDNQGNEIPPDLVTIVRQGEWFGWPACQPPAGTPQSAGTDCSGLTPPTVGIQAHSAPLGLAFVTAGPLQGDLVVVQHGSWNRTPPAEPKLLRVHFEAGRPVAAQDLAVGWQGADGSRWGRPAGVLAAPDGSLIISDDQAGVLYRITFSG